MTIKVSVEIEITGDAADDIVVDNLKQVGFAESAGADGGTHLSFDGEISGNDLAYAASMMRTMKRN